MKSRLINIVDEITNTENHQRDILLEMLIYDVKLRGEFIKYFVPDFQSEDSDVIGKKYIVEGEWNIDKMNIIKSIFEVLPLELLTGRNDLLFQEKDRKNEFLIVEIKNISKKKLDGKDYSRLINYINLVNDIYKLTGEKILVGLLVNNPDLIRIPLSTNKDLFIGSVSWNKIKNLIKQSSLDKEDIYNPNTHMNYWSRQIIQKIEKGNKMIEVFNQEEITALKYRNSNEEPERIFVS